jgi:hypothetical protein
MSVAMSPAFIGHSSLVPFLKKKGLSRYRVAGLSDTLPVGGLRGHRRDVDMTSTGRRCGCSSCRRRGGGQRARVRRASAPHLGE